MSKKTKETIIIFFFLFASGYIFVNWNDVSWIFNYRVASELVYDFFYPYQNSRLLVRAAEFPFAPGERRTTGSDYFSKSNYLEIPSLDIWAPLVAGQSDDLKVLKQDLSEGTVFYPGSAFPGQKGQTVILGHSAPSGWPKIRYDWIFSEVGNMKNGEKIVIYFNGKKYSYKVQGQIIVNPGEELKISGEENNNIVVLVSCWPPGKDYKRIAVYGALVE